MVHDRVLVCRRAGQSNIAARIQDEIAVARRVRISGIGSSRLATSRVLQLLPSCRVLDKARRQA